MKKYLAPVLLIVLLSAIWTVFEIMRPKEFSWMHTYINTDKNPYGCYIFYHETAKLHDQSLLTVSRLPASEILSGSVTEAVNYMVIAENAEFDNQNLDSLLNFIASGNSALIVAGEIEQKLIDTLGLSYTPLYGLGKSADTMFKFSNNRVMKESFPLTGMWHGYFSLNDSLADVQSIIEDLSGRAVMVQAKWGEGVIILGKCPLIFTNWFILGKNQEDIPFRVLSFLPESNQLIWDEFQKQGRTNNSSPLRVILSNPSLRMAYFLTLFGILLILIFETRRRQSVVAVIEPVKNTSFEFVRMVGLLHYGQKDYKNIGIRKINNLLENIRLQYNFLLHPEEPGVEEKIHLKTGYQLQDAENLMKEIRKFLLLKNAGKANLVLLNRQIEDFYKHINPKNKKG